MIRYTTLAFLLATTLSAAVPDWRDSEQPPAPIGGYETLAKNIEYPEMASKAGIEGTVLVKTLIDENGQVLETVVVGDKPPTGMAEAACKGIQQTRFEPARQYGRPMATWITIPVVFDL